MRPPLYAAAVSQILEGAVSASGLSLVDLTARSRVLLVFLRYTGCTFCRETLGDIAARRDLIENSGIRVVLVHTASRTRFERLAARYRLAGIETICDPARRLYAAFGLKRGSFRQLFGACVLRRAFAEGVLIRCGFGAPLTDPTRMPGVFLLEHCEVVRSFRHRYVSDRPDYLRFCGITAAAEP